jgi:leucine dehydrogenase
MPNQSGSANNQLKDARHGAALKEMGILYPPDYIANAGSRTYDADHSEGAQDNHARAE